MEVRTEIRMDEWTEADGQEDGQTEKVTYRGGCPTSTGLEISVGHQTMTDSNKCLTNLKLLQSDIVSERKIKTM